MGHRADHLVMKLTDEALLARAMAPESARVERKLTLKGDGVNAKIHQSLCAFANDLAGTGECGVLFVGVSDAGALSAQPIATKVREKLADFLRDGSIQPPPAGEVRVLESPAGHCVAVVVEPHVAPPVRFKGDIWVRVGPSNRRATREEEIRLAERGRANDLPFESQPARGMRVGDLDPRAIDDYLDRVIGAQTRRENQRPVPLQLRAQRLLTLDETPTHAGMLLLGRSPSQALPNGFVQMVRHAGQTRTTPIVDQLELRMNLLGLIDAILTRLRLWNPVALDMGAPRAVERPAYPVRALQEVVTNAVVHRRYDMQAPVVIRWFSDRVECMSPGGPLAPVTASNFESGVTSYRNPRLAEALRALGYIQRHGLGVAFTQEALRANGNPPAEFDVDAMRVNVILRRVA